MNENTAYSFRVLTLRFSSRKVEKDYNKAFFKQDLYSLRFVIALGVILSIAFIFVDFFQYTEKIVSIAFRGGMALLLSLFGASTYFFKKENYKITQWIAMAVSVVVTTVFFIHYHLNDDPNFDVFLSNILTVLIFIIATIMGFRFRYSFLINSCIFISYILYIEFINYNAISERQISQLVVIYMVSNTAAYVLEKQKMNFFITRNQLKIQKNKVENLDGLKNKLLSIISHDLRGPIVSLKGLVSLFNHGAISKDELKVITKDLERDLNNTSNLLDNVLAWAKSQLDGLDYTPKQIQLKKLIEDIINLYTTQAKNKAINLQLSVEKKHLIYADKEMMHIIFRNLLSNAIKFTPIGGTIKIETNEKKDFVEIIVNDNGAGIPSEKLKNLYSLDKDHLVGNSQDIGAGLGLVLVKEFTELNKGEISCDSSIGNGTTFSLLMPKAH